MNFTNVYWWLLIYLLSSQWLTQSLFGSLVDKKVQTNKKWFDNTSNLLGIVYLHIIRRRYMQIFAIKKRFNGFMVSKINHWQLYVSFYHYRFNYNLKLYILPLYSQRCWSKCLVYLEEIRLFSDCQYVFRQGWRV